MDNVKRVFADDLTYCATIEEAIADADLCFIFTEWPEIRQFDLRQYAALMKTPLVFDGRNCYDLESAHKAGILYESIGRKQVGTAERSVLVKTDER